MKSFTFFILGFTLILISCEKKNEDQNSNTYNATLTVYNVEEWTVVSPQPVCSGAVVKLISATDTVNGMTNDEGKVLFEDLEAVIYEIQVTKDDLSNLIDKDNSGKGFVSIGIFQSEAEISAYTGWSGNLLQPNAQPGDIKIADTNYDNKIDGNDRVSATYYKPYVDVNADMIINELDKVIINDEGEMGYQVLEDTDMDAYIGS